jgi:hypothetical protein
MSDKSRQDGIGWRLSNQRTKRGQSSWVAIMILGLVSKE